MPIILHITTDRQWHAAQQLGYYRADSLDSEGFIHCSDPEQIAWVANTFYSGQLDLILLCIDRDRLTSELRYDEADGKYFPHLYGPLNLDAVVQTIAFEPDASGRFEQPEQLR